MDEKFKNLLLFKMYATDEDVSRAGFTAFIVIAVGIVIAVIYKLI